MSKNENLDKAIQNLLGGLTSGFSHLGKVAVHTSEDTLKLATTPEDTDIIALSSGNVVRKVRTPEGAKYYKQPIGSVIISDGHGHVLEVLHKGNGTEAGSPSISSFQNDPKVAKYNAAVAGKHTGAGNVHKAAKSPSDHITGEEQTYDHSKYGHIKVKVPENGKVHETGTGLVVEHPDGKMIDYKGKSGAVTVHEFGKKLPKSSTKPAKLASGVEEGPYASPYPGVGTSAATAAPSTIEKIKNADLPQLPEKPTNGEAAVHAFQQAAKSGKPVYMVRTGNDSHFSVQPKPGTTKDTTIAVHPTGGMYRLEPGQDPKPMKLGGAAKDAETSDAAWLEQLGKVVKAAEPEKKSELPKPDKTLLYSDPNAPETAPITVKYHKDDTLHEIGAGHAMLVRHPDGTGTLYSKYQPKQLTTQDVKDAFDGKYKDTTGTGHLLSANKNTFDAIKNAPVMDDNGMATVPHKGFNDKFKVSEATGPGEFLNAGTKLSDFPDKYFDKFDGPLNNGTYEWVARYKEGNPYGQKPGAGIGKHSAKDSPIPLKPGAVEQLLKDQKKEDAPKTSEIDATTSVDELKKLPKEELDKHFNDGKISAKKYKEATGVKDAPETSHDDKVDEAVAKGNITHSKGEKLKAAAKKPKTSEEIKAENAAKTKAEMADALKAGKFGKYTDKIESSLKPGDRVYQLDGKSFVVAHPDGSYTRYSNLSPDGHHVKYTSQKGHHNKGNGLQPAFKSETVTGLLKLYTHAQLLHTEPEHKSAPKNATKKIDKGTAVGSVSHVKATKTADGDWEFTSHTYDGKKITAVKKNDGTYALTTEDGQIAGQSFSQMKVAKAWVDANGDHTVAEKKSAAPKLSPDEQKVIADLKTHATTTTAKKAAAKPEKPSGSSLSHVKATKTGQMEHGKPVWVFTSHTSNGDDLEAHPTADGKYEVHNVGTGEIHGPFAQMKAAKAWVDENGTLNSSTGKGVKKTSEKKVEAPKVETTKTEKISETKKSAPAPLEDWEKELLGLHTFKGVEYQADLEDKTFYLKSEPGNSDAAKVAVVKPNDDVHVFSPGSTEPAVLPAGSFTVPAVEFLEQTGYKKLGADGKLVEPPKPKTHSSVASNGQKFTATDGDKVFSSGNAALGVAVKHPDGSGTFFYGGETKPLTVAQTTLLTDGLLELGLDGMPLDNSAKAPALLELDHPGKGKFSLPKLTGKQELFEVPKGYIVKDGKTVSIYAKSDDGSVKVTNDLPFGPFDIALKAGNDVKPLDKDGNPLPKKAKLDEPAPKPVDVAAEKPDMTKVNPITGTTDHVVEQVTGSVAKSAYAEHFTGKDVKVSKANPEMGFDGYYVKNFSDPASSGSLEIHKQDSGKWAVVGQDSPDAYAENFKTLADAKQWVSQYGQPDEALVKKATVSKTPYGTDFIWNGKKYHLTPGAKAWETADGNLIIRGANESNYDYVVTPDGFSSAAYQNNSLKEMNSAHKQLASAPALTFGKHKLNPLSTGSEHTKNVDKALDGALKISGYAFRYSVRDDLISEGFYAQSPETIARTFDYFNQKIVSGQVALTPKDYKNLFAELEFYSRAFRVRAALDAGKSPSPDDLTFVATKTPKKFYFINYQSDPLTKADIKAIREHYINEHALADGVDLSTGKLEGAKALATKFGVSWAAGMDDSSADMWLQAHYLNRPPYGLADAAKTANSKIAIAKVLSDAKYADDVKVAAPKALDHSTLVNKGATDTVTAEELASLDPVIGSMTPEQQKAATDIFNASQSLYNMHVGAPVDASAVNSIGGYIESLFGSLDDSEAVDKYLDNWDLPKSAHAAASKIYQQYKSGTAGENSELENFLAKLGESAPQTDPSKPVDVPDDLWKYVNLAATNPEITDGMGGSGAGSVWLTMAVSPMHTATMPDGLANLYTQADTLYDTQTAEHIRQSIKALVDSGKYASNDYVSEYKITSKYTGKENSLYLKPGDTVYQSGNGSAVVWNEFSPESSYQISYYGKFSKYFSKVPPVSGYEKVKEIPVTFDAEFVKSKLNLPDNIDDEWVDKFTGSLKKSFGEVLDEAEMGGYSKGDALIAVKGVLDTPDAQKNYPKLVELGVGKIPDGTLAYLFHADSEADYAMAELAAHYGYFNMADKSGDPFAALGLQHGAVYEDFINKGDFSKEAAWDYSSSYPSQFHKLAQDLGVNTSDDVGWVGAVSDKLTGATKYGPNKPSSPQNDELQLSLIKGYHGLKGAHTKQMWADQHGNKWMTKAFETDSANSDMRVSAENAANNIGRLYGFGSPESRLMTLPDTSGKKRLQYVQHLAPAKGDIGYHTTWDEVPTSVVHDAMQTHVLNWVISDHDGHGENFMVTPDGTHAFGIDHGQAGRFFGEDKLDISYHATNPYPTWFEHVYRDMQDGLMPKEKVDALRDTVLRKAAQVATRNEKQYLALMEEGVKYRTSFPSKFPTKEAWINAHNERRKAVFDDFAKLYEGIYKKAGYEWDSPTLDDYLPKKVGQAHSEVTPDFVADVKKSGSHGQPLMFAGSEISDNHMITYTTHAPDGSTTLRSQASLLPGADTLFTQWLKKQTIEKVAGAPVTGLQSKEQQEKFAAAQLPDLPNAHSALVNYAKTVSTHAQDGEYNAGTVSTANTHKNNLQAFYDEVKKQTDADPTKLVSYNGWDFKTAEQQDTWLAQTSQMLEQFAMVDNAKAQGVKVSALYKDAMPFEAPSYTPTPNLDTSGKPKVAAQFDLNGKTYQKYSDGNYIEISNGKKIKSTAGDFADAATNGQDTLPEEPKAKQSEDTENVVAVANKVIKVKYQKATSYTGEFTPGTNTVMETGSTTSAGAFAEEGMSGHEYEIQHGNVIIRYQPRSGAGAVKAQQGLLRIEVKDWDGETSSMQDAIDILRETGLNMDPATEDSLELSYYRQLHAISKRRNGDSAKLNQLRSDGDAITAGADDEIEQWRKAFNSYYGAQTMQEFIDSKGYLPILGGSSAHESVGTPQYLRPDTSVADYKKWVDGKLPQHYTDYNSQSKYSPDEVDFSMAMSGYLSTEARLRVLARWQNGNSSPSDQKKGSSNYAFFRQGKGQPTSAHHVMLEPEYAMMLSNYAYGGDMFGDSYAKSSQAPFDLKSQASLSSSSNEIMIKNMLPPSAFAFMIVSKSTREKILKQYKDLGIAEIGGVPVGEKFITSDMVNQDRVDAVWERAIAREKARKAKAKVG